MKSILFNIYIDNWFFDNILKPAKFFEPITVDLSEEALIFLSSIIDFPRAKIFLSEYNNNDFISHVDLLPTELRNILYDLNISSGKENLMAFHKNASEQDISFEFPHILITKRLDFIHERIKSEGVNVIEIDKLILKPTVEHILGVFIPTWFGDYVKNQPFNIYFIEDPFFFSKFKIEEEIKKIFWFLKNVKFAFLNISCKRNGIKEYDNYLTSSQIELRIKKFKEIIYTINNKVSIEIDYNASHDRFLFTNKDFFILGNSFNMRHDTTTYVVKSGLLEEGSKFFNYLSIRD